MDFFENAYRGRPTWETLRPQPAVVRLADEGRLRGRVLDVGCGTGENAMFLASRGFVVTGIDFAGTAIEKARARAGALATSVEFLVGQALDLAPLGREFDCAIDVGLFHCLQPDDRARYAASVAAAVRPGGALFVVAWSDRNVFGRGPQRISGRDLRAAFATDWIVERIDASELETNLPERRVHAWLAEIRRR